LSPAQEHLKKVDDYLASLSATETSLNYGYAKLGTLLNTVSHCEYWREGYKSFGSYLESLKEHYGRSRATLHNYFSTVKALLPYMSEDQLNKIGIEKARVLKKAIKQSGMAPSKELFESAIDPKVTVKEMRSLAFKSDNSTAENSLWRDLDFSGEYTDEEFETVQDAIMIMKRTDPVIGASLKEWQQLKEVLLRFSMETLGSHAEKMLEVHGEQ
jgi:hypothetical protein